VTSDARPRAGEEDDVTTTETSPGEPLATTEPPEGTTGGTAPESGPSADVDGDAAPAEEATRRRRGRVGTGRPTLPLVPVLAVLLVALLAVGGWLWATRTGSSAVTTADHDEALLAARAGVVDLTSFDHLTLDDDIAEVEGIAVGDLREETVAQLQDRRDQITEAQAVVSTEVIGAGVTEADGSAATALLVIQSTTESAVAEQAQVVKYRIEVDLQKVDGRWMLSGISGR
jgi:Mce-associated membrane protein